jgi:ketopantoate reductase
MRIAVFGSGAIGGYFGALLAKGRHDVAFIARGAVADTRTVGAVDLVLFCVKSYDMEPAAQALAPLMDTAVVTFQNDLDNVEVIASVVGSGAVLVGAVYIALQIAGPGVVLRTGGEGNIVFGELRGPDRTGPANRQRIPGTRAIGHWSAPRQRRGSHASHQLMRGDRGRRPGGNGYAFGRRSGSHHRAGSDAAPPMAIVDGPRPGGRPSF